MKPPKPFYKTDSSSPVVCNHCNKDVLTTKCTEECQWNYKYAKGKVDSPCKYGEKCHGIHAMKRTKDSMKCHDCNKPLNDSNVCTKICIWHWNYTIGRDKFPCKYGEKCHKRHDFDLKGKKVVIEYVNYREQICSFEATVIEFDGHHITISGFRDTSAQAFETQKGNRIKRSFDGDLYMKVNLIKSFC